MTRELWIGDSDKQRNRVLWFGNCVLRLGELWIGILDPRCGIQRFSSPVIYPPPQILDEYAGEIIERKKNCFFYLLFGTARFLGVASSRPNFETKTVTGSKKFESTKKGFHNVFLVTISLFFCLFFLKFFAKKNFWSKEGRKETVELEHAWDPEWYRLDSNSTCRTTPCSWLDLRSGNAFTYRYRFETLQVLPGFLTGSALRGESWRRQVPLSRGQKSAFSSLEKK